MENMQLMGMPKINPVKSECCGCRLMMGSPEPDKPYRCYGCGKPCVGVDERGREVKQ